MCVTKLRVKVVVYERLCATKLCVKVDESCFLRKIVCDKVVVWKIVCDQAVV